MSKIAIVGMGCRFADAPDLQAYWDLTLQGKNAFGDIPADRWNAELFHSESRRVADKTYAPAGAFIKDVRSFPALALGIPPRRVEVMDPQQRFSLEVCRQAIEDSGRTPADMPSRTGVFIGITASEWRELVVLRQLAQNLATGAYGQAPDDPSVITNAVSSVVPPRPYTAPGVLGNMCAATVAQELDLKGPAYTVDSACASGLIAMYDAMLQLQTGAIDAALAGGVYLCLTPDHHVAFARIGAMSQQGVCRPFDKDADGFVQGDGAAVVVLKRYDDAVAAGDRIYAVVEGIALNSDGSGDGPMAPNREGQADVIRRAWEAAGVEASGLGYVETHGTGTPVGDPTELQGLSDTVGPQTVRAALGSAKANIGHTMSAAGIAGLIRASLALYHETIPPMANFVEARADLEIESTPFFIPKTAEAWSGQDRKAAVSSFGFGGTNAHCVLSPGSDAPVADKVQPELILLSAPTPEELRDLANRTARAIASDPKTSVAGVAKACGARPPQKERLSLVASSVRNLVEQLETFAEGSLAEGCHTGTAKPDLKIAFLFPGQGAQRPGMLRDIRNRFPRVAQEMNRLNDALNGSLKKPLLELIYPELQRESIDEVMARKELTETANCQPALLACGVALATLLKDLGIRPAVTTGHSLGEFTAAAVAEVCSAEDALRFVAARGQAMASLPGDHGAMAALRTNTENASKVLVDGTVIANVNHPKQVVASGTTSGIEALVKRAQEAGIDAIPLEVSHGFHSPVLHSLDVSSLVDAISFKESSTPLISAIDGCAVRDADHAQDIFKRHALAPVQFLSALEACNDMDVDIFLQVASGGPLSAFARGTLAGQGKAIVSLATMDDEDGGASLLSNLGRLFTLGVEMDLRSITGESSVASIPPCILPRETYWCVKEGVGRAPEVDKALLLKTTGEPVVETPEPVEESKPQGQDEIASKVMEIVARVSAYPLASLNPTMTLMGQLGFDSLMVADLVSGLSAVFAQVEGIPQEVLVNNPTVADLIDHVRFTIEHGPQDASFLEGDLQAFSPFWLVQPRHEALRASFSYQNTTATVVGADSAQAHALVDGLLDLGAKASFLPWGQSPAEASDLLLCVPSPHPQPGKAHNHEDLAENLITAIDAQAALGGTPHTALLYNIDDYQGRAAAAVIRCLAREWPQSVGKALAYDPTMSAAQLARSALDEFASGDLTTDVRFKDGTRCVPEFRRTQKETPYAPSDKDTILITGGTRGIGLKLATALSASGAQLVLLGRSSPSKEATELTSASEGRIRCVQGDVLDADSLTRALNGQGNVTVLIHAAGVLADGALGTVDMSKGNRARAIKSAGLLNATAACGASLKVALGLGSHAARFGNRHQAHYSAGNALMSELMGEFTGFSASAVEFGPWQNSEMVQTIPEAVRAQMRAEGVDFIDDEEGIQAVLSALGSSVSPHVQARRTPVTSRSKQQHALTLESHPFLQDHAIDGTAILPLASAADLMAYAAAPSLPFSLKGLRLFRGIAVSEDVDLTASVQGRKVEVHEGPDAKLAYRCSIETAEDLEIEAHSRTSGGDPPSVSLESFYGGITFHGPMLQGITAIDAVGEDFVRGRVKTSKPKDWIPSSTRTDWLVDPLAFDSAMQMAGLVAWQRYERAGTPFALERYTQLVPFSEEELTVEVRFGESNEDSFNADIAFYTSSDELAAYAQGVKAELRKVETTAKPTLELKPEWTDPSLWQPVKDMKLRLQMADAIGIGNPYFHVHEGTARDTTLVGGNELVHFSGYNYLGLSGDARVVEDVKDAVEKYGTSVSASRVASGERPFHQDLEAELAASQGVESSLLFTAGHAANVSTIGHLMGPDDLIIHDEFIHDSALGGIKMSGSSRRSFRHEDPEHLAEQLDELRMHYDKVLIIVEGVYSMDGDICDLPAYIEIKKRFGCLLMVDEAHSFGVIGATGQGCREHFGIDGSEVDVWMGTLSKSLASCGGWIGGSKALMDYLRYTVGGFVFSAGMTPANAVAGLSSLRLMLEEPQRVARLQENAQFFYEELVRHGLDTGPSIGGSAVVPLITGNSIQALFLSKQLMEEGINVQPIVYPAVADDAARLRFFLTCLHTKEQLARTAKTAGRLLKEIRESSQFKGKKV
jgi:8-amino-7-oxononanoate synthase